MREIYADTIRTIPFYLAGGGLEVAVFDLGNFNESCANALVQASIKMRLNSFFMVRMLYKIYEGNVDVV